MLLVLAGFLMIHLGGIIYWDRPLRDEVLQLLADLEAGSAGAKVFIDDDGIIFDAALNQTNIGGNNNKVRVWL